MGLDTARATITGLVENLLAKRTGPKRVAETDSLADAGLTSLDMVGLMLAIEDAFDLEIPQKRMTPANFRTIATIEALVTSVAVPA
jgi:acyl carrier protein